MTALVPLNNVQALDRFKAAGVGEIYVGFHDDEWERHFPGAELNRMSGFGVQANPFDFNQMCEQLDHAHELGIEGFVCFNASTYTPDQVEFIAEKYLPRLGRSGAKGVILSGQALIKAAREQDLNVTISTIAGIYNAKLAAYYRDRGATRLILPRDLSADEISQIVHAVPDVEYEVFMMRNGCLFSDSHCLGCHRANEPSLCTSLRTGSHRIWLTSDPRNTDTPENEAFLQKAWENEQLLNERYHRRTCGLCALWRFEQLGVNAYKVVGRGDDVDDLCFDAALVVRNAELACSCATEEEYLNRMELPRDPATLCGMHGLSCYYPELSRATRCVSQ